MVVAHIGAFVGVVIIGFWLGAAFMRWRVREELTMAGELRDAARDWSAAAEKSRQASAEHREIAEEAAKLAEERHIRAAEYEQTAHDMLDRARALHSEFMA